MLIQTSRFGPIEIEADDLLLFSQGIIGFPRLYHWVLLADEQHPDLAWLQAAGNAQVAFALVNPRQFQPQYQVRVPAQQLDDLELSGKSPMFVLAIVSKQHDQLTLNLKAPLILNVERHLGRQVVTSDEQPLQFPIGQATPARYRKSA
jgi:flagellar assembly factor FliW